MAKILTEMQCMRVKELNKNFRTYADRGWMCEGSDRYGICNAIFNNDTDEIFWADYELPSPMTSENGFYNTKTV